MLELIGFTIAGFVLGIIVSWIYLGETTRQMIQADMNLMYDVGELNNQKLSLLKDLERMRDGLQNERE